jgi:hypothetical protein
MPGEKKQGDVEGLRLICSPRIFVIDNLRFLTGNKKWK